MTKSTTCREIQPDLVATGIGEAPATAAERVHTHVATCGPCRHELERYRGVDRLVGELRRVPAQSATGVEARTGLERRLADLRRRMLACRVWNSPIGPLLIARSEEGIVLVEYLDTASLGASRALRAADVEVVDDRLETEAFYQQLLEYLRGERSRLAWPLDLRLARSAFQRDVLQATAELPYGAVTSYGRIARQIGKPAAVRAVAQALRWNPLPIVVPCHRVIGGTGSLTGYAGNKVALKERLLSLEGVPTTPAGIQRAHMYHLGEGETEYCLPTCGALPTYPLARLTLYGSRERAEASGLRPCTTCRPDLHPLSA